MITDVRSTDVKTRTAPPPAPPPARRKIPQGAWVAGSVSLVTLLLGLFSMAAGQPLLFPSLAPATVSHAATPRLRSTSFYHTVVGQLLGIGGGYFAVWVTGAMASPGSITAHDFTWRRMWACVVGMLVTLVLQSAAGALNPPAGATALLIALGAFLPVARDFWTLVGGVLIMAVLAEGIRRARLAQLEAHEGHAF